MDHTNNAVFLGIVACLFFTVSMADSEADSESEASGDLARGWNSNIDWVSLEDGEKLAKESNKPMMIVIHKSWCGACKALKPKFSESKEIEEMSKSFVMVNIMDDEEPSDSMYAPDGSYIPRILFADSVGTVQPDVYNTYGSDKYKYFYPEPRQILGTMKTALEKLEGSAPTAKETTKQPRGEL